MGYLNMSLEMVSKTDGNPVPKIDDKQVNSTSKYEWTDDQQVQFKWKIVAMMIGNCLEWFDFAIFGALADIIGDEFFPSSDENMQIIKSLSLFGAAFVMRPIGGILMGWIGDTLGRKIALEISISLMLIPSLLMGCLPTYHQAGMIGTGLLVTLRLLQGVAVGGELIGAFIYTVEATRGENRGFWGSVCKASGSFGTALGMGFSALLRRLLSDEEMHNWGWRVPFLVSIVFGLIGLRLRQGIREEDDDQISTARSNGKVEKYPALAVIKSSWPEMIVVWMVGSFWGVGFYSCFVWMGYFLSDPSLIGGDGVPYAWEISFAMNLALVFSFPLSGILTDYIGRKLNNPEKGFRFMLSLGIIGMITLAVPCFALIVTRDVSKVIVAMVCFVAIMSSFGALPAFMVSLFPPHLCYSGVGIAYNIANGMFSGTAPLVQTSLVLSGENRTLSRVRPALYLVAVSCWALVGLLLVAPWAITRQKRLLEVTNKRKSSEQTTSVSDNEAQTELLMYNDWSSNGAFCAVSEVLICVQD